MQDTFIPFIATASEKLEAVAEVDGEEPAEGSSPDEPGAKPEPKTKESQETKDDAEEAAAETSSPESESASAAQTLRGDEKSKAPESVAPAGGAVEGPDASTVEPMSQESLGGLDGLVVEGAKHPMSMSQEEESSGGIEQGEPMSKSGPEHLEEPEAATPAETAHVPAEDDVLGRKRSAEQTATKLNTAAGEGGGDQGVGVAMETDETKKGGGQAAGEGQEGREGAAVSGTCDLSDPSEGR